LKLRQRCKAIRKAAGNPERPLCPPKSSPAQKALFVGDSPLPQLDLSAKDGGRRAERIEDSK
jgi:hypothetical protein